MFSKENICECAGIGRQARLRGVCCMTYGFKSRHSHQEKRLRRAQSLFVYPEKNIRDLTPKRAASVKKNSPGDCFLVSRCAAGYRMRSIGSASTAGSAGYCVPSLAVRDRTGLFFVVLCGFFLSMNGKKNVQLDYHIR